MLRYRIFQVVSLTLFSIVLITFFGCEEDESVLHTLSIIVNHQDGGAADGEGVYEKGSDVTLTATAHAGYEFINWTDENDYEISNENEFIYTMPGRDVTLRANLIVEDGTTGVVSDIDGNEYQTVFIGGKEWMAENLRTTSITMARKFLQAYLSKHGKKPLRGRMPCILTTILKDLNPRKKW